MTASHADRHDRDKLARWHRDMTSNPTGRFPVYAVFLVSPEDRASHDVFRRFRASFEGRSAGFEYLVIFGQHGVSSTVQGFLPQFGLSPADIPVLALFAAPSSEAAYTLPLQHGSPGGPESGDRGLWAEVLAHLEEAADKGMTRLDLASLPGVTRRQEGNGPLLEIVGKLLNEPPTSGCS